jgi:predicted esterase YcpF (UPF0227 family)
MVGRIDRPEEYEDIATKCVDQYRIKNKQRCLVILSTNDDIVDTRKVADELEDYYDIVWDDEQGHKFKKISQHLQRMKAFKEQQ